MGERCVLRQMLFGGSRDLDMLLATKTGFPIVATLLHTPRPVAVGATCDIYIYAGGKEHAFACGICLSD